MRFFGIIALVVLLSAVAVPVTADGGLMLGGIGVYSEKPQMPPSIWASLTAVVSGEEVAALSTDTPVSVVGPRHPDMVYRLRVQAVSLPNLKGVTAFLNEKAHPTQIVDDFYVCDLPALSFRPGANLLKVQLRGKFGTDKLNLVLFQIKWRTSESVMGGVTVYMTNTNNPIAILASRGWVQIDDRTTPPPAPPIDYTPAPPAPQVCPSAPPAPTPYPTSASEVGPATLVPNPAPVRFFVDGVEVATWISTKPGERLAIVARTVASLVTYEICGGGKVASGQMPTPGTTIFPINVPSGDTILTVKVGADTGTITIKGVS